MKRLLLNLLFISMGFMAVGQTNVSGTVIDGDTGDPLIGASVFVKGTTNGTITDIDGNFSLTDVAANSVLEISYIGYGTKFVDVVDGAVGTIRMTEGVSLEDIVITGVTDIAKDRETPVAVSTLYASEIQAKLGNQELPELLNTTPSVYATKSGGGFGDSRINIRGFDQVNTAVLINGVPVNDMENGRVFWSNWAGLGDVTSAMQVQRGLGSSKLAISSVGGTLNIITKTTDREKGGKVILGYGNDNFLNTGISYSTGRMNDGQAISVLFSRKSGDGYITGTSFEGYNYFLGWGWNNDDDSKNLQFVVTGAPQVHNQRTTSFFNMATLGDYAEFGNKYNYNHGLLNGEEFNWRRNFYHKPIASLNYEMNIGSKSRLSTVAYASYGRGGGTGDIGRLPGFKFASSSIYRDNDTGFVRWDDIVNYNSGQAVTFSDGNVYQRDDGVNGQFINESSNAGLTRRASINSHNWFGIIANLSTQVNDNLTFDVGIDLRKYKGIHYRRVDNFLGADGYFDDDDINNPEHLVVPGQEVASDFGSIVNVFKSIDDDEKIDYYNDGLVGWQGVFGQLEYKTSDLSTFVQFGASNQGFQRVDYFNYLDSDPAQTSEKVNRLGGNIKGGLNYNINATSNVFFNTGYYSKQPLFDAVFLNFLNDINPDLRNEKIFGLEVGYGYSNNGLDIKLNAYRTTWKDRFLVAEKEVDDVELRANIPGVEQVHMGIELESYYRISKMLKLELMASIGDWQYKGSPVGPGFDDDQNYVEDVQLFLDGVKVGDAAQMTARLGAIVTPMKGLNVDLSWYRAANLYAAINAEDFGDPDNLGSLKLPSYNRFDGGISYGIALGGNQSNYLRLRLNINNLFDTEYIAESRTNIHAEAGDTLIGGIDEDNKAFFGFGRTWNVGATLSF